MKVIFFDIDGVLNFRGTPSIDESCLSELKRIVQTTGACTVISSSWKQLVTRPNCGTDAERELLMKLRHDPDLVCLGWTPDIDELNRENEVEAWLEIYEGLGVTKFIILDDQESGFSLKYPNQFIQTTGYTGRGLTRENANLAIQRLGTD